MPTAILEEERSGRLASAEHVGDFNDGLCCGGLAPYGGHKQRDVGDPFVALQERTLFHSMRLSDLAIEISLGALWVHCFAE